MSFWSLSEIRLSHGCRKVLKCGWDNVTGVLHQKIFNRTRVFSCIPVPFNRLFDTFICYTNMRKCKNSWMHFVISSKEVIGTRSHI